MVELSEYNINPCSSSFFNSVRLWNVAIDKKINELQRCLEETTYETGHAKIKEIFWFWEFARNAQRIKKPRICSQKTIKYITWKLEILKISKLQHLDEETLRNSSIMSMQNLLNPTDTWYFALLTVNLSAFKVVLPQLIFVYIVSLWFLVPLIQTSIWRVSGL